MSCRTEAGAANCVRVGAASDATYDGPVELAARERGSVLVTRDVRARSTYEALGVRTEVPAGGS